MCFMTSDVARPMNAKSAARGEWRWGRLLGRPAVASPCRVLRSPYLMKFSLYLLLKWDAHEPNYGGELLAGRLVARAMLPRLICRCM